MTSPQTTIVSNLSKKRKPDEQEVKEVEESVKTPKKSKKDEIQTLFNNLITMYPEHVFRIHKTGLYVERQRNDKSFRRACKHAKFMTECLPCTPEYTKDKTVVRRKVADRRNIITNTFQNRSHVDAPNIPFSEDLHSARIALREFIATCKAETCTLSKPCLFSTSSTYPNGQGNICFNKKQYFAHDFSWMVSNNRRIPDGFVIRHLCKPVDGNYGCLEPSHLEIGTQRQNMLEDKIRDGTLPLGEAHVAAKLTNEQALAIFQSYGNGTQAERALRFGVSRTKVNKIDKGVIFSSVTKNFTGRIAERNRALKKNKSKTRKDATREEYKTCVQRIEANVTFADNGKGCIFSNYAKTKDGYAITSLHGQTRCHIVIWEYYHNDCKVKPENMIIKHSCDEPACCNKDHLQLGTNSQNQLERWQRTGLRK